MRTFESAIKAVHRWWASIDSFVLIAVLVIISIGAMLIITSSPPVAERLRLHSFYFVHRQLVFLVLAMVIIVSLSYCSDKTIKKLALSGYVLFLVLLVVVMCYGDETKGAKRWISIFGFSIQPSEFLKPFFAVISGLILSERYTRSSIPGFTTCSLLYLMIVSLLILQPDIGMTISFTVTMMSQFFIAGLPMTWILVVVLLSIVGGVGAYVLLPHVTKRIDSFLNPQEYSNYQVTKSLEAYINGGLFGQGPGEGVVKATLPDSHTDFIFAVASEEFGAVFAATVVLLFFFVVCRGFLRISKETDLFHIYSVTGLLSCFAFQALFNIGVTLHIFPTKGMTLPFISYGGSSVLSFAITIGFYLSLTRKRFNGVSSLELYQKRDKLLGAMVYSPNH
ncbi:FtsW/RodA/SpoVE family cell cycle protein [Rickettsiales endosymbiont of Peranema trichophorum]|uniref:FtsW/RodA/SpoVE family cell cycle protein n=1 Tax=Rickettsiales endosymbiont of Peranema trichophorum TaxID=2486577 RepID=UPI0013EEC40D|nr:putative peptidoglycan glycosyltransferase FtsW [Rickettsiales endosymbiont of Peranema trichophorum]